MARITTHNIAKRIARTMRTADRLYAQSLAEDAGRGLSRGTAILGVVTDRGPNDEPDWSDERYWVESAYVGNTQFDRNAAMEVRAFDGQTGRAAIFAATNLHETTTHSHAIQPGTPVIVRWAMDRRKPIPRKRYWFEATPPAIVTVTLVTFPSSGEHYGDHIVARMWDGETPGDREIYVLLPDELRMSSWNGRYEFIDGFRVDYEPVPGGMPWARIARIDSQDYRETQVIVPWYIDANNGGSRGPSILRCWTDAGVHGGLLQSPGYLGETRIGLMDANNAGRAWAEKYTQQTSNDIVGRALRRGDIEQ